MQDQTAQVLGQASPKEKAQILATLDEGHEIVDVQPHTRGLAVEFSDGSSMVLAPGRTGGTVKTKPTPKPIRQPAVIPIAVARPRARGAGRPKAKAGARSSSSSSDDPDEPEPPRRRLCQLCNREIPPDRAPQARYCSAKHAERDRKRRTRARARDRDVRPQTPTPRDERRYLEFEPGDYDRLLLYAVCRCNGSHIAERDPELGHRCAKCGRQRPDSPIGRQTLDALARGLA